jgi:hypothetical protein
MRCGFERSVNVMTRHSGRPAPEPDRGQPGRTPGSAREKGEVPSPDDPEAGETPDSDPCTAHDRAS